MKARKLTKETIMDIDVADRGFPSFDVGDTVEVSLIVKEGNKERLQGFAGDVIATHGNGIASTFTVRRLSANKVWVEKIFPYHSPVINSIKIVKRGDVRRAKLFYLRDRVGKAAKVKEKILTKEQKVKMKEKNAAVAETVKD